MRGTILEYSAEVHEEEQAFSKRRQDSLPPGEEIPSAPQADQNPLLVGDEPHPQAVPRRQRTWPEKFRDAFRGVALGVWGQNSFLVHGFFSVAVVIAGLIFQIPLVEWLIVGLCIVVVWTAEMFNSALERLARAINPSYDPAIRDALDIGSGAVLVAAFGAAVLGSVLFLSHFLRWIVTLF